MAYHVIYSSDKTLMKKVNESDTENLSKLPYWAKCVKCGEKPREHDWLIEIVPHSTALMHQSCAANQGQIAGLNLGMEKGD